MKADPIFFDVNAGKEILPITDYHLRGLEDGSDSPPPPEMVGGLNLELIFAGGDSYSFYCIDNETGIIYDIDPEVGWPPTKICNDWKEFGKHIVRKIAGADVEEDIEKAKELFGLEGT